MASRFSKVKIEGALVFTDPVAKAQIRNAKDKVNVELDLSGVEYMDSTGVQIIYDLCRHLKKKNGYVKIRGANPNIREMMEICSLNRLAEILEK